MPGRLVALLMTATVMGNAAGAGQLSGFAPFVHDSDRPGVVRLDGEIDAGILLAFNRAMQRLEDIRVLELASGGGSAVAALLLARELRAVGLRVFIPAGSACALLFFAAVGRDAEGRPGVHAIAVPGHTPAAGQTGQRPGLRFSWGPACWRRFRNG
ncbi:MAG: hypothetical protein CSA74_06415 [Rhodobacterales bacterium]|nr:MAG: hypothetical protein CSA74_06415 [Rhodobacterales bacterium]